MARVTIEGGDLVVRMEGWDRVLALKSEMRVPLAHVRAVQARPADAAERLGRLFVGFKAGTSLPGVIRAGSFYVPGEGLIFLDIHDAENTIGLDLEHERYKRAVVQVDDPEETAALVTAALGSRSQPRPGGFPPL